jgi:hypothetical protein
MRTAGPPPAGTGTRAALPEIPEGESALERPAAEAAAGGEAAGRAAAAAAAAGRGAVRALCAAWCAPPVLLPCAAPPCALALAERRHIVCVAAPTGPLLPLAGPGGAGGAAPSRLAAALALAPWLVADPRALRAELSLWAACACACAAALLGLACLALGGDCDCGGGSGCCAGADAALVTALGVGRAVGPDSLVAAPFAAARGTAMGARRL